MITAQKPIIRMRQAWGAVTPDITSPNYYKYNKPIKEIYYGIVVHHSDGYNEDDVPAYIRAVQKQHMANGWGDIGYHYLIDQRGVIYQGRNIAYRGCHVAGGNTGRLGICCLGDFTSDAPNLLQMDALYKLILWYGTYLSIAPDQIKGHNAFNPTACPGIKLAQKLPGIRKEYKTVFDKVLYRK